MPIFEKYISACEDAVNNENIFNNFKRISYYQEILEHVTVEQGLDYFNYIKEKHPYLLENLNKFCDMDLVGNPNILIKINDKLISPTTLRYVKVLGDLIKKFKDLSSMKIIEIGAGYGGQAKVILDKFNVQNYYCVDLPAVCDLISKYLQKNNYVINAISDLKDIKHNTWDLCISNYAFSELPKNLQDDYIENVFNKSSHGYITMNFISHLFGIDSYSLDEIKEKLKKDIKIEQEEPYTFTKNCVIYW